MYTCNYKFESEIALEVMEKWREFMNSEESDGVIYNDNSEKKKRAKASIHEEGLDHFRIRLSYSVPSRRVSHDAHIISGKI